MVPGRRGQPGPGLEGRVDIALHLAQRDRRLGQPPVGEVDPVEGVLPALVDQSSVGGPAILDEVVTVRVAVGDDPVQGTVGVRQQGLDLVVAGAPPPGLLEQHDEQRGGVGGAVVDVAAAEHQIGREALAPLVHDPTGLLLGQRVCGPALERGQGLQRADRQRPIDRQGHPGRQQRVPAEQGHEPRRPGSHRDPVRVLRVEDPQHAEVLLAAGDRLVRSPAAGPDSTGA